jgi:hypothetical protein
MEHRLIDPLGLALSMALVAVLLAHDDLPFVPLGYGVRPMQHETDQELVLLGNRKMMTLVTIE